MAVQEHRISETKTLLQALEQINGLVDGPLVLFVLDGNDRMVGTLTDGDARRGIIAGIDVHDTIENVMHRNFNFLRRGVDDDVKHIKQQKLLKMKLVPILDNEDHIVDIIDLERYRTKLPIDAVIMAGGKGERLRPLTEKTPKPLIKVGDKEIIDYNVDSLISYGIQHISVTVNYLAEQIKAHYRTPHLGVQVKTVQEPEFLGTIGAAQLVKKFYNDTILIMNSDLFTNIDFEDFYLHFMENDADMSAAAVPFSVSVPYGIFQLERHQVKGILEKPTYNYYVNAGIYLIKRSVLENMLPKQIFFNATDFMEKLISSDHKVIRYPLSGYWIDIGNKDQLAKAREIAKHIN
ncbi:MAG: nucleotidyltransferase family protein [Bacteroidaceae bacterium]